LRALRKPSTVRVVECLSQLGGIASRAQLVAAQSRKEVDRALAHGDIVAVGRGRYALASVDLAAQHAHALNGVLSHTSAALHHGWEVKIVPERPHITVPRKRKVSLDRQRGAVLHRADLTSDEIDGIATSKELTLTQCLRGLPFGEALAVADSAARHGELALLRRVAITARGPGSPQIRRVINAARGEAANPFESALRAIALDVTGLEVEPQVLIRSNSGWTRPDLVDRERRIVLEADSFEWHGERAALRRDAKRYNQLVVDGWTVLRFAWEDVMFDPGYVHQILVSVVALVEARTQVLKCTCGAA
jgi:very-short-patch-repair endonuclease